jgi:hypothetical protein
MRKIALIPEVPGKTQNQQIEVRDRPMHKPPRDDLRKPRNLPDADFDKVETDPDLDTAAS